MITVIGELLDKIRGAEERAAKIIADAVKKAAAIEASAQFDIEKIKMKAQSDIATKVRTKKSSPPDEEVTPLESGNEMIVDQDKITAAKKFVIAEFHKRYPT